MQGAHSLGRQPSGRCMGTLVCALQRGYHSCTNSTLPPQASVGARQVLACPVEGVEEGQRLRTHEQTKWRRLGKLTGGCQELEFCSGNKQGSCTKATGNVRPWLATEPRTLPQTEAVRADIVAISKRAQEQHILQKRRSLNK